MDLIQTSGVGFGRGITPESIILEENIVSLQDKQFWVMLVLHLLSLNPHKSKHLLISMLTVTTRCSCYSGILTNSIRDRSSANTTSSACSIAAYYVLRPILTSLPRALVCGIQSPTEKCNSYLEVGVVKLQPLGGPGAASWIAWAIGCVFGLLLTKP